MEDLNKEIKNKKLFYSEQRRTVIFVAMTGIVLFTVVFLIAVLISKNKKPIIPVVPVVQEEKNNITPLSDEYIKSLTIPVKDEDITPLSDEYIKSLTIPVKDEDITPLSDEYIKSLTISVN